MRNLHGEKAHKFLDAQLEKFRKSFAATAKLQNKKIDDPELFRDFMFVNLLFVQNELNGLANNLQELRGSSKK